jgi:methyl-accepting chemotaxis protein
MNTIRTTWISRLVSGTQLDAQAQELEAMTGQLDEQTAVMVALQKELSNTQQELQVRSDEQGIERQNAKGILDAIDESYGYIEFDLSGNILNANNNFLELMEYQFDEIEGKHHRIFVDPAQSVLPDYAQFWADLNAGETQSNAFKRITKSGKEVWIQAVYAPVIDENGRVFKIVKIATDITVARTEAADYSGQIEAIGKSQAVIEFNMDGTIIQANDNFLNTMGYQVDEIKGQHHSMFADTEYKNSSEYRQFWEKLNRGEYEAGEFKRIGKGGKEIWIQASYNPIMDLNSKPFKVVKYATDVTEQKLRNADFADQLKAIGKSQAVIEFNMDGTIIQANDNFLNTMGYRADEIKDQHHSMFADAEYKNSGEYRQFWEKLNRGEYEAGEFKRIGKGGKEIWIQASYNPIMDLNGKPFKVVKYATDVTEQKLRNADFAGQIEAIGKSQAVIEFNMDGTIIQANDNFLNTMGYRADEIKGQHHSMFADTEYKNSHEYRQFWETLNRGEYQAAEYKRMGKGGKVVWIQASYNPIMDLNNKPFKVVKYATDITGRKNAVNEIKRVLLCLSDGDLTTSIEENFEGEFQELGDAINSFVSELRDTISQIKAAANTINEASTEIAEGNADLSSRTEEQASSLEETASSMEELTGTVRLNSENANQANSLASEASTVAIEGGETIQKVVTTMASINESANKISDIIGVIDGIAFQTNILALNAAVEAARAGEQGRGFAVVASEVRTLAQRSANAAKDIKELISDSVSKIENGNVLVNQSGETMEKVVTSIKRVNDIMSEIAAASAEQATGIDEVGKAITQMDEVTQQNAALVEEAAAAAESLQSQAVQLTERVASFKMDDSQQGHQQKTIAPSKALSSPAPRASKSKQRTPVAQKKIKAASPQEDEWESF